jgi:hypothetical protein
MTMLSGRQEILQRQNEWPISYASPPLKHPRAPPFGGSDGRRDCATRMREKRRGAYSLVESVVRLD